MAILNLNTQPDTWQAFVDAARALIKRQDDLRWRLGDLCVALLAQPHVTGHPAPDDAPTTLAAFANELDINRRTLNDYYNVALAYRPRQRARLRAIFPQLAWSHYRAALLAPKRARFRWLRTAAEGDIRANDLAGRIRDARDNDDGGDTPTGQGGNAVRRVVRLDTLGAQKALSMAFGCECFVKVTTFSDGSKVIRVDPLTV